MKEEQNEFERLLKEKAERFELKPSPEVWQEVQSAIQKKRRRVFAWWLMAAALFAVLGTGTFFMLENKSHQPATSTAAENNPDRNNSVANNSSSKKSNTEKNSPASSNNDNTSETQNKSADITPSNNQGEKISKKQDENARQLVASSKNSKEEFTNSTPQINEVNSQPAEYIASLSPKQLSLSLPEASIHARPLSVRSPSDQKTSIDFSSALSSKHSFYFEADAMPLASFVRNHSTPAPSTSLGLNNAVLPPDNSSYSFTKGFSAGGNFIVEQDNKWLFGIGLHLTKTHLEANTAQQSVPLYDTSYVFDGYAFQMEIIQTGDTIVYQSQGDINQWFDVSLITGVKLFPSSPKESFWTKNHLRILAGVGFSRLLADANSNAITPLKFTESFDSVTVSNTVAAFATIPVFYYQKNQVQLFSEISYQRDLTSRLSFTAGMQLHYYPMNLLNSSELSQHLMWVGLKGGLMFRL